MRGRTVGMGMGPMPLPFLHLIIMENLGLLFIFLLSPLFSLNLAERSEGDSKLPCYGGGSRPSEARATVLLLL